MQRILMGRLRRLDGDLASSLERVTALEAQSWDLKAACSRREGAGSATAAGEGAGSGGVQTRAAEQPRAQAAAVAAPSLGQRWLGFIGVSSAPDSAELRELIRATWFPDAAQREVLEKRYGVRGPSALRNPLPPAARAGRWRPPLPG